MVYYNDDLTIFLATNLGGLYNLKDSYSQFRVVGIASFYASGIYYDENQYNKMYDENGTLIMTKFSAGVSSFPSNDSKLFCNYGQYVDSKFKYQYNNSGYFNYLEITSNIFGPKQIVNSTMSKFPIIQYVKSY